MKEKRSTKLAIGIVLMVSFVAVLVAIFMPLFGDDNALDYLDNLYNSISKGSAYYIPKVQHEVEEHAAKTVSLNLDFKSAEVAGHAASLLADAGAPASATGATVRAEGDLPTILRACLEDADDAYHGRGGELETRRGVAPRVALHAWWSVLGAMERDLNRQRLFADAHLVHTVQTKAVECAYNYYGIAPSQISERWGTVLLSLVFYVIYTVWYGYAILYLFEGLGLQLSH
jgi:hypothetical protein